MSLQSVLQQPNPNNPEAEIIIITHDANKAAVAKVLETFHKLDVVHTVKSVYRVEG
ncbi:homoserine dehydrogenase [compost metagenome]